MHMYLHVYTGGEDEGVSEGETEGAKEAWEGTGRHNRRGRGDRPRDGRSDGVLRIWGNQEKSHIEHNPTYNYTHTIFSTL